MSTLLQTAPVGDAGTLLTCIFQPLLTKLSKSGLKVSGLGPTELLSSCQGSSLLDFQLSWFESVQTF